MKSWRFTCICIPPSWLFSCVRNDIPPRPSRSIKFFKIINSKSDWLPWSTQHNHCPKQKRRVVLGRTWEMDKLQEVILRLLFFPKKIHFKTTNFGRLWLWGKWIAKKIGREYTRSLRTCPFRGLGRSPWQSPSWAFSFLFDFLLSELKQRFRKNYTKS
jgi:hypothetical protein